MKSLYITKSKFYISLYTCARNKVCPTSEIKSKIIFGGQMERFLILLGVAPQRQLKNMYRFCDFRINFIVGISCTSAFFYANRFVLFSAFQF